MPARKSTKYMLFAAAITIAWSSSALYQNKQNTHLSALNACIKVDSKLPLNHVNHPCQQSVSSNQSWWSWLKGDSPSSYLHFLDLIELLHSQSNPN